MNIGKLIKNPLLMVSKLGRRGKLRWIPDKMYIKLAFRGKFGRKLDLKNPQTLNEKMQWLKLYYRNPEYIKMVDKYAVKDYIKEQIGEEYVIPLLGVWDKAEDIDFDSLPDKFVLKCTHDSGSYIICTDKKSFDKTAAIKKLSKCLKRGTYWLGREWYYTGVTPRVIAEEYIEDSEYGELRDYKFYAFDGKIEAMIIIFNRNNPDEQTSINFFNENFEPLNVTHYHFYSSDKLPDKPKNFELMKEFAKKLSKGIPHVRVDFYEANGKLYFSELTFFSGSGLARYTPDDIDYQMGAALKLPEKMI